MVRWNELKGKLIYVDLDQAERYLYFMRKRPTFECEQKQEVLLFANQATVYEVGL